MLFSCNIDIFANQKTNKYFDVRWSIRRTVCFVSVSFSSLQRLALHVNEYYCCYIQCDEKFRIHFLRLQITTLLVSHSHHDHPK